jgi:predicted metal-binding membrane protein
LFSKKAECLNIYTGMIKASPLAYILNKDRFIVLTALFILCVLAWLYIIYLYRQMNPMNMDAIFFAMPMTAKWSRADFLLLFLMWFVMMIAMMTPSVAPLILIFTAINRKRRQQQNPFVPSGYLLTGYFLVWAAFSLFATFLQWLLQRVSLLNPEMITTSKILGGIILIIAGTFQFTPLKNTCLNYCRAPISFIHHHWKEGKHGALRMGLQNGMYCLGCCWILMMLLFVSGIMNIFWIAVITLFVVLEKVIPKVKFVSPVAGISLIAFGIIILLR